MNAPLQAPASLGARTEHTSSRALASLLLAAGVSALVVGADQILEPWADRHAVAAWIALWAIAVAAIAVLRGVSRSLAQQTMRRLDAWSAGVAQRRADRRLWAMAQKDERLMGDLQAALDRDEEGPVKDVLALTQRRTQRVMRNRLHYI